MIRETREADRMERAAAGLWVSPRPFDPPEWYSRIRWPLPQHLYPVAVVARVREEEARRLEAAVKLASGG
jgi:hypothetical protein